ncbi:terpene cyclase [Colletotrichum camelliae]|nr:terpene cyclase [Colletotrichum camelliae]
MCVSSVNIAEEKKSKHRTKSNYTILASVFYSSCKKEKLLTLTKYQYWIFWFDDEIDTGGELTADAAGTRHICDLTLQCVEHCLHYDPAEACFTPPVDSPGTVEVLYEVLAAMRPEMGPMSIERMRRELREYIEGVARQQAVRQGEHLPDPWYHFDIRIADVGVFPSITQNEFAMDFELPDSTRYHEAMETIAMECTRLAILINEILSLQKEFRVGQLENMVLLFMNAENVSVHESVHKIISLIRKHYAACEDAVARLPWTDDEVANEHIREYVRGCRRLATGTGHWAYLCTRYFDKTQLDEKWGLVLNLEASGHAS